MMRQGEEERGRRAVHDMIIGLKRLPRPNVYSSIVRIGRGGGISLRVGVLASDLEAVREGLLRLTDWPLEVVPDVRAVFVTRETEATTTGSYHFGQRFYDSNMRRWTQPDPLDQSGDLTEANSYAYAGGDPINRSDPSGLIGQGPYRDRLCAQQKRKGVATPYCGTAGGFGSRASDLCYASGALGGLAGLTPQGKLLTAGAKAVAGIYQKVAVGTSGVSVGCSATGP